MTAVRVRVRVHGEVQGVGYRWFTREAAQAHRVAGWVRNRIDGTVEAELHGAADAVDAVLAEMRSGPAQSRVDDLITEPIGIVPEPPAGFEFRPTV